MAAPMLPGRPYSSAFHGKLPDRSTGTTGGPMGGRQTGPPGGAAQGGASAPAAGGGLSDEQRDEVNEAFALFDLDRDQRIDYHEFKVALKALGFDLPKQELMNLLTTHGVPPLTASPHPAPTHQRPGASHPSVPPSRLQLTLPAFTTIATQLIAARDPLTEIHRAFELFDTNGKGMITLDDLRRVARELGEGLEEEELRSMIEEFDLDGKGGVGRDEFVGICMG